MIKLFLGLLVFINTSFSIAARKDSAAQQQKADFDFYLNAIEDINEITPHAMAHFFDTTTKKPLYPPSQMDSRGYTFDMDKYKRNYTVFGNNLKWDDVKEFIKNNADEINKETSKQNNNIYTVTFDTARVPTEKITSIQCEKKKCKKRLANIKDLDMFFNQNPDNPEQTKKVEEINKQFNNEIRYTTLPLDDIKKIRIVVDSASPKQLKTSYPKEK